MRTVVLCWQLRKAVVGQWHRGHYADDGEVQQRRHGGGIGCLVVLDERGRNWMMMRTYWLGNGQGGSSRTLSSHHTTFIDYFVVCMM